MQNSSKYNNYIIYNNYIFYNNIYTISVKFQHAKFCVTPNVSIKVRCL